MSEDFLAHYGIIRRSGRYPWGSGENPYQRNKGFLQYVDDLKREGLSETEIAKGLGTTTTQLRAARAIARNETRKAEQIQAQRLKDKGYSNVAIGERMGIGESSVRNLLNPAMQDRTDALQTTANVLKKNVDEKKYLDVGAGTENHMGVSATRLNTAVAMLREQGYEIQYVKVEQQGTGKHTTIKVLVPPGTPYSETYKNRDQIRAVTDFSEDNGRTFLGLKPPQNVSSDRVHVRYAEDGGASEDGVMYIRRGVEDLNMGDSKYAQVRIAVDGTHYLKGMAVYSDNMPKGADIVFNTNKSNTGKKHDAMKRMEDDPDNPFGAVVSRQSGALNILREEGDWNNWSRTLSSQMLSKQSPSLAKRQLELSYQARKDEFDEINSLTNPVVKKKLLETFADSADSSAVHLKAAAMPRQATQVILPINGLKDNEIYAPNYRNGEKVVLIRYPHGGTFEIPELTVNNRHREAKAILGQARDAVGINANVAGRLSGADFDGDSVLVIPNNRGSIKTSPALEGLKDFDPISSYPKYDGMKRMSSRTTQIEMGNVSNLITDMTIKGATQSEIARAVRHSMVVIDAEKHHLNWKQSEKDNGIPELKRKYQGSARSGASTLVSRASSEVRVPERIPRRARDGGPVDPSTGRKVYTETGATYTNAKGKVIPRTTRSTRMAEATDARSLSSGTPMEEIYADHANRMKALANQARKTALQTKPRPYSPSARTAYQTEVDSLRASLNVALKNAPLERQAQLLAGSIVSAKRQANPNMDASDVKKIRGQALQEARNRTGARKQRIQISDREWEAIQSGAVSTNLLTQILNHTDLDEVKKLATPRSSNGLTAGMIARATAMLNAGYTQAEVADALGVSASTISKMNS